MKKKKSDNDVKAPGKKKYKKPIVHSEKMITFGALCSGMKVGGRKTTAGSPDFCSASRLLS